MTGWLFSLQGRSESPALVLLLYTNVPILLVLLLEKLIARELLPWRLACYLHMSNLFLMLVIPIVVINVKADSRQPIFSIVESLNQILARSSGDTGGQTVHVSVGGATLVTAVYAVLFLKMWSYVQVIFAHMNSSLAFPVLKVNHWCRCSATILGPRRAKHQSIYRQVPCTILLA